MIMTQPQKIFLTSELEREVVRGLSGSGSTEIGSGLIAGRERSGLTKLWAYLLRSGSPVADITIERGLVVGRA